MFIPHDMNCAGRVSGKCDCGADESNAALMRIAERFSALQARVFGEGDSPLLIARAVYDWHCETEALRLDLLADASESDLAHDVGGIIRRDVFQSARYALAYHPRDGFAGRFTGVAQ